MLKKWLLAILGLAAVVATILPSLIASQFHSPKANDTSHDEVFTSNITKSADVNHGLTLRQLGSVASSNSTDVPHISFFVFNHTNEAIVFPDQDFGLKAFAFDQQVLAWQSVTLLTRPENLPKTLPAKTEIALPDQSNESTLIFEHTLPPDVPPSIRLYVQGVGAGTNKLYGAWLDVSPQQR